MNLESGKSYINGLEEVRGPMADLRHGLFQDERGRLYFADGRRWRLDADPQTDLVSEAP